MPCNICGNEDFGFGPGGRLSVTGQKPYCVTCGSLERHRVVRAVFGKLMDASFKGARVLQFSRDPSVVPEWFDTFEVSVYGEDNSLDLMRIDRASGSFDIILCNHVLEHVKYDNAALVELVRILSPRGFVFLTFPDPARRERTAEFAEANLDSHGHWRVYGRDVADRFRRHLPHAWVFAHEASDPVTGAEDVVYLLARASAPVERFAQRLSPLETINDPFATRA